MSSDDARAEEYPRRVRYALPSLEIQKGISGIPTAMWEIYIPRYLAKGKEVEGRHGPVVPASGTRFWEEGLSVEHSYMC